MNEYQFITQDNESILNTNAIIDYYRSKGYQVLDVQKNQDYQYKDIDLLINVAGPKKFPELISVEVKVDRYTYSKNYYFETIANIKKNSPGCMLMTQADYIFYYFPEIQTIHIWQTELIRQWFLTHIDNFEAKIVKTFNPIYKTSYTSQGVLVPRDLIKEAVIIKKLN